MPNDYSRQWFEVFLETMPSDWTAAEVDGVRRRLPLPAFRRAITNRVSAGRLTSTIEYADGTTESMDWELFTPDEIARRAALAGLHEVERCCWWDETRSPDAAEQRYQMVLEKS